MLFGEEEFVIEFGRAGVRKVLGVGFVFFEFYLMLGHDGGGGLDGSEQRNVHSVIISCHCVGGIAREFENHVAASVGHRVKVWEHGVGVEDFEFGLLGVHRVSPCFCFGIDYGGWCNIFGGVGTVVCVFGVGYIVTLDNGAKDVYGLVSGGVGCFALASVLFGRVTG